MFQWLGAHSAALNVALNLAMVALWIVYFQLLLFAYKRQRRPKILINRGAGAGLDARCLISNMSAEPIYIQMVIATLEMEDSVIEMAVTEQRATDKADDRSENLSRQGPLDQAEYADIGSFGQIIEQVVRNAGLPDDELEQRFHGLHLAVVAIYGPEDVSAAGWRSFDLPANDEQRDLLPRISSTRQLRSHRARRKLDRDIRRLTHDPGARRHETGSAPGTIMSHLR